MPSELPFNGNRREPRRRSSEVNRLPIGALGGAVSGDLYQSGFASTGLYACKRVKSGPQPLPSVG